MLKLSVIVPVYQVKPYLERCLHSIISQTFHDFEIIIVDDGSTDGSQDICDIYAKRYENISVIHKPNGGLSSARNAGIEAASGKYIMFVDSDDMLYKDALDLEIKTLEKYDADALICSLRRFKNEEELNHLPSIEKLEGITLITGVEVEKGFFNNSDTARYVSSCGKIYKRELFDNIRFPEGRLFEDEFTTYRLYYKCKKVLVTDSELYYYFVNPNGITQNLTFNKRLDEYDAQIERIIFYSNNKEKELYHLALLEFLRSAQWDLKSFQNTPEIYDSERGMNFQAQYINVLKQAENEKIVSFANNYDYYILAYPNKIIIFRLKRQALKFFKLMK